MLHRITNPMYEREPLKALTGKLQFRYLPTKAIATGPR
jgi:hypothetical protein